MHQYFNKSNNGSTSLNKSKRNVSTLLKIVCTATFAVALVLLVPCPCQGQTVSNFVDYDGEPEHEHNRTHAAPKMLTKHKFSCTKYFYIGEENVTLPCVADGEPKPSMKWRRIGGQIHKHHLSKQNWSIVVSEKDESVDCTFRFPRVRKEIEGIWRCVARNAHGNVTLDYNVKVLDPNRFWQGKPWIFIAFLTVLVLVGGLIHKVVKLKCCQPRSKLEETAEYKKEEIDNVIEEVCFVNPSQQAGN